MILEATKSPFVFVAGAVLAPDHDKQLPNTKPELPSSDICGILEFCNCMTCSLAIRRVESYIMRMTVFMTVQVK